MQIPTTVATMDARTISHRRNRRMTPFLLSPVQEA